jgi:hypothetical protein
MRTFDRIAYYLAAIGREALPYRYFKSGLNASISQLDHLTHFERERINYCNMLDEVVDARDFPKLADLRVADGSRYYIDLMRVAKGFGQNFRINTLFGDITHVPDTPTIVKSRPIAGDRKNSVLLPLDAFRHFYLPSDPLPFGEKKPSAVWRGSINNELRRRAVETHYHSKRHDIAHLKPFAGLPEPRQWLSVRDQLKSKYIISLEGNDVATNLKWIMGSNSVAISPKLHFETWFMEGKLIPGVHFVEVQPDLSDLDEKIAWCEDNQDQVQNIVREANTWVNGFRNQSVEFKLSQLVLKKYADMTGQVL